MQVKGQYTLDYVVQRRLDVRFLFSVSERKVSRILYPL